MRKIAKIPRILQINSIEGLTISVVFNNGESRLIDFRKSFAAMLQDKSSPVSKLLKSSVFNKVKLNNHTLSWDNIEQGIQFKDKQIKVPFEIGADTLYKASIPVEQIKLSPDTLGAKIKAAREKEGMTQLELATRSGTSRSYISRIENDEAGIELHTLEKIVAYGLRKKLEIKIKS
ncbi:helix-turn-helix domain-containing protein [Flavitalea sp.]|nr:helix-turn-helix transcriptional regulator [Flavitalea sp.]